LDHDYLHKNNLIIVNLVEETGKESLLGDAFVELLSEADRQGLTYVQFDFHEHWFVVKNIALLYLNNSLIESNFFTAKAYDSKMFPFSPIA